VEEREVERCQHVEIYNVGQGAGHVAPN